MVIAMISIDEMQKLLDDIVSDFPPVFFEELNGGVVLLPDAVMDEHSQPDDPLFIMGEYHSGGGMGRFIAIYYGSFAGVFEGLEGEELMDELKAELVVTIKHEFRHHIESLAGADDLEREDAEFLGGYLNGDDEESR
jgi:hypothetical protein